MYHHFGSKDGLLAALYFIALDDQLAAFEARMNKACDAKSAVAALIETYLAWVTHEPRMARFMFQARQYVSRGPHQEALAERNKRRFGSLLKWLGEGVKCGVIRPLPREVYASLLIGQSENYCRAWLSGRVQGKPLTHAPLFVDAAWRAIAR